MALPQVLGGHLAMKLAISGLVASIGAGTSAAYPGGTPDFQTDVGPYCAACHSSTSPEDLSGLGERATAELAPNKHFAEIQAGTGKYVGL